jgi:hypothetical protein
MDDGSQPIPTHQTQRQARTQRRARTQLAVILSAIRRMAEGSQPLPSTQPHRIRTRTPEKISSQSAPTHEIFLTLTPAPRIPTIEEAFALSQPLEKVPRSPAWQRKQKKPQSPQKRASRHQKKKGAATCSALLSFNLFFFRLCVLRVLCGEFLFFYGLCAAGTAPE